MATNIIAFGVEIQFADRDLLTVPLTMTGGYTVSAVSGSPAELVTFGTFHRELYVHRRGQLDRAGRTYTAFEPD